MEVGTGKVGNLADLNRLLEEYCVDAVVNQLDVLNFRVGIATVALTRYLEAVKLDEPVETPDSDASVETSRYERSFEVFHWLKISDCLGVPLKCMQFFLLLP